MRIVEIQPGLSGVQQALKAVHELFEDEVSVALIPAGNAEARSAVRAELPTAEAEPALVLATSGSMGEPKAVEISLTALASSAEAAAIEFRGPATWLTALPVTGIGGLNTVIRSALNGTEPVIWDGVSGAAKFDADDFQKYLVALRRAADKQRMAAAVSLVPTQISRLAASDLRPLASLDFVLVGGAGIPPTLKTQLLESNINLITTYGATETCGGVWWNQKPIGDTQISISADGEIVVSGSTLATQYRDGQAIAPQWHTGDIGELNEDGLTVLGRKDRVIKTNGLKISLDQITKIANSSSGVETAFAIDVADGDAGRIAVVAFVGDIQAADLAAQISAEVTAPRLTAVKVSEIPQLLNGKPDTDTLRRICETSLS